MMDQLSKNVRLIGYLSSFFLAVSFATHTFAQATIDSSDIEISRSLATLTTEKATISNYREKSGMFSSSWAVYFLSEGEDSNKEWFIEINGKKLGPFDNFGELVSFSPNGQKVVFAAKEKNSGRWSVFLNGTKKWEFDGLAWGRYSWPKGLKGRIFVSQTQSVAFSQSDDNKLISFFAKQELNEKNYWTNITNGKAGNNYDNINLGIKFIKGKPSYWAWKDGDEYLVIGDQEYGPYDDASTLKTSEDGEHFAFVAERNGRFLHIFDGSETKLPGKIIAHAVGNDGNYALAYEKNANIHVIQNGTPWPEVYSETVWHQFRMTPNGKVLAGWFKKGGKWSVIVNGETGYGPYESYFFVKAGDYHSLFLGKSGTNVAYYVRHRDGSSTGREFYLNGKKVGNSPDYPGFSLSYYQDESGEIIGTGGGGSVATDFAALADSAAVGAINPLVAKYYGSYLVYTKSSGEHVNVMVNNEELGPFTDAGQFFSSQASTHFGFIAENQNGKWIIVDGKYQTPYFSEIYRPGFAEENELAFLTVENGKVVRVSSTIEK